MHSIATPLLSKALDVSRTENDSRVDGFNDVLCSTPQTCANDPWKSSRNDFVWCFLMIPNDSCLPRDGCAKLCPLDDTTEPPRQLEHISKLFDPQYRPCMTKSCPYIWVIKVQKHKTSHNPLANPLVWTSLFLLFHVVLPPGHKSVYNPKYLVENKTWCTKSWTVAIRGIIPSPISNTPIVIVWSNIWASSPIEPWFLMLFLFFQCEQRKSIKVYIYIYIKYIKLRLSYIAQYIYIL